MYTLFQNDIVMAVEIVNWLEIPVMDMNRARTFYETIFDIKIVDIEVGEDIYPCFPDKKGSGFSAALVQYDFTGPGRRGPLVYLNASPDITATLKKILASGGTILKEKTEIAPGFGYFALFEDTEGNMFALQSDQ
jgi:predicted enzyme related to lactoylglutathione lyase